LDGRFLVDKDVGFIIEKKEHISPDKNRIMTGLKVTPYGLPTMKITFNDGTFHNSFIFFENKMFICIKEKFILLTQVFNHLIKISITI
jgi:hypothetical protein